MAGGKPFVIPLEPDAQTLPTAVFVDFADRRFVYGTDAARAMMDGQEGRFLRALKSILGTPLAQEKRQFLNEQLTLIEVIARFLSEIKSRTESFTGLSFDTVLSGRPVRFHSEDAARDTQAELDLRAAYDLAGFKQVDFLPEPEAAALSVAGQGRLLIVDIGGGTSDFTLCDRVDGHTHVLASTGVRIGGTDFDRQLSLQHAMPLLGAETGIGDPFSKALHRAPRALFHDLASWEKIAFVYDPATLREVRRWVRLAQDSLPFERLAEVLDMHLGHDIAYAVEAGKIAANAGGAGQVDLTVVEKGLEAQIGQGALRDALESYAQQIGECALETLALAGCTPEQVDEIVFVGGSSLLGAVQDRMRGLLPAAKTETAEVFTAVVHGLAIAAENQ
jgi:hypothetical chaperone protein